MFLYSDECGGFCVCNIMSRMSGYVLLSSKFYDLKCFHNHAWSCSYAESIFSNDFPVIDDVIPECYTFLFSPSDWISFGNGTSFPRDSFVQQRGTPVKIFLKMRILASSFQWGVSQVLRGLRFRDNCVQSFQFFTSTLCHLWNHFLVSQECCLSTYVIKQLVISWYAPHIWHSWNVFDP